MKRNTTLSMLAALSLAAASPVFAACAPNYAPGACSLAAHITAREARVPVDLVRVDLMAHRTQSGADYYGVNPRGYVPAIQLDDGMLLTEVAALVQFLADKTPTAGLLPPTGSSPTY